MSILVITSAISLAALVAIRELGDVVILNDSAPVGCSLVVPASVPFALDPDEDLNPIWLGYQYSIQPRTRLVCLAWQTTWLWEYG